jgi:hypothetical protein
LFLPFHHVCLAAVFLDEPADDQMRPQVAVGDGAAPSFQWSFLMAEKPTEGRRKLVEFDAQTWHALNLLSRETMKTFQELADEAFRDLLHKYKRPTDLKAALRESAKGAGSGRRHPRL